MKAAVPPTVKIAELEQRIEQLEAALRLLYDSALIVSDGVDPAHLDPGIAEAETVLFRTPR